MLLRLRSVDWVWTVLADDVGVVVTHVMAKALETQANHMDQRAETSTTQ